MTMKPCGAGGPDEVRNSGPTGKLTPAPEPKEAPGLIETMRMEPGGSIPLLDLHLRRLHRSCAALGHSWPGDAAVRDRVARAVRQLNAAHAGRVRLLLAPTGDIEVQHGMLETLAPPVRILVEGPRMPGAAGWLGHKTSHRPWYHEAAEWLGRHPGIFDVLYWDEEGWMCEGSRSNLYMRAPDGRWLTPPLRCGVLPGVQREALLLAGKVSEAMIHRDDFLKASEWRISNALRGWLDAVPASRPGVGQTQARASG